MKAKFERGDKVLVHTNSSKKGVAGSISDILLDNDDNVFYYQVKILSEDWIVAENELELIISSKYSLNCPYFTREHDSLDALMEDVCTSGMDPNYYITIDGKVTGDLAADLIQF